MSNYRKSTDEYYDKIDISAAISEIWKWSKKLFWIPVALSVVFSAFFMIQTYFSYRPKYEASATFTVAVESSTGSSSYYNSVAAEQMAKTFPHILTSGILNSIVADDMGLPVVPGTIEAEAVEGSNLFTLRTTADSAQTAYDILTSVITCYPDVSKFVLGETSMTLLDESGIPTEPANSWSWKSCIKKGVIAGVLLGLFLIVLYAILRKTVKSEEDLKKFLNVRCFAVIPKITFKKRTQRENMQITIDQNHISEEFRESIRVLRARVEKQADKEHQKTILVTSAVPKEGKSMVAANLALALAKGKEKVLLIDADLRNPSIRKTLGLEEKGSGLVEVLKQKSTLTENLQYLKERNLWVLAGSTTVDNASELLGSRKMERILEEAQEWADYIIIDTSPVSIMADASVLAKYVDSVLFVIREDYTPKDKITIGIERIMESEAKLMGCILNVSESAHSKYGYYYGGRYKYGYGYYGRRTKTGE